MPFSVLSSFLRRVASPSSSGSCQNGATTTPTAPGPTWAPIAAPSSLTCSSRSAATAPRICGELVGTVASGEVVDGDGHRPLPAASTARCTSRFRRGRSSGPSPGGPPGRPSRGSIGFTARADPRTAAAEPMRPPRRKYSGCRPRRGSRLRSGPPGSRRPPRRRAGAAVRTKCHDGETRPLAMTRVDDVTMCSPTWCSSQAARLRCSRLGQVDGHRRSGTSSSACR